MSSPSAAAVADETDNSAAASVTDVVVTEARPDTVIMDPEFATATAAKVKCLLSRKKVGLVSCKCSPCLVHITMYSNNDDDISIIIIITIHRQCFYGAIIVTWPSVL